ncbi:MAG: hypothetical protein WCT46_02350 [Candidatus Gracilibacteria bacterium]|jgi:hypothetical protein
MEQLKFKQGFFGKKPDGWKKKGNTVHFNHKGKLLAETHPFCGSILDIGISEQDCLFKFCNKCEIVIERLSNNEPFPEKWIDKGDTTVSHTFCYSTCRLGQGGNGELFKYCPRCHIVVEKLD